MKNKFRNAAAVITSAIMITGILQLGAEAANEYSEDFNDGETASGVQLANKGAFTNYTYAAVFTDAAAGKNVLGENQTADKAYTAKLNDYPYSESGEPGVQIPFYDNDPQTTNAPEIRTLELSMKYDENCDYARVQMKFANHQSAWGNEKTADIVRFENGRIYTVDYSNENYTLKDTGLTAKPGEWYRIAIEEHYQGGDSKVYINGIDVGSKLNWYIFGNRWTQVNAGLTSRDEEGTRSVSVSVDDIKVYTGAYTGGDAAKAEFSVTGSNVSYNASARAVIADDTVSHPTVKDIANAITTAQAGSSIKVIDSLESNIKITEGEVHEGNVAVITSEDGLTLNYVYITGIGYVTDFNAQTDSDKLKFEQLVNEEKFPTYVENGTYRYEFTESVSGKDSGDYAFCSLFEDAPYEIVDESGVEFPFYKSMAGSVGEVRTLEFLMKYNSGVDYVTLKMRVRDKNGGLPYTELIRFSEGKIIVGSEDTGRSCKPEEWYRVVLEEHYDEHYAIIYLNGVQYGGEIDITAGSGLGVSSNLWTQLAAGMKETGREGSRDVAVTVDDVKIHKTAYVQSGVEVVAPTVTENVKMTYDSAERIITVNDSEYMNADEILNVVDVTSGEKYIIKSLASTERVEGQATVSTGNVVVVRSADSGTYEYIYIKANDYDPGYVDMDDTKEGIQPGKFFGEGPNIPYGGDTEIHDVAFYGIATNVYPGIPFGFTVTGTENGSTYTKNYIYDGTVTGAVRFGVIIQNLSDELRDNIAAEYYLE